MSHSFPLVAIHPETHDVVLELVYASHQNVAGRPLYGRALCLLHRDADAYLRRAIQSAASRGYRLKIFDPVRGKPCRLVRGQERGRQGRPCAGFSAGSVVAQCTGG